MSHDEKMAFMRQFLEDTAGDMRLLDVVTDEEVQKLIDLYDAWEVVNDGLGAAHDANDALLNDKNKAIGQKAKENIETAENAANAAFAPVEDYYNELLNTHNIEDEEGDADETETPSAETTLSDAISAAEADRRRLGTIRRVMCRWVHSTLPLRTRKAACVEARMPTVRNGKTR